MTLPLGHRNTPSSMGIAVASEVVVGGTGDSCWRSSSLLYGARRGIACALLVAFERSDEHHGGDHGDDADTHHLVSILLYLPECLVHRQDRFRVMSYSSS